MLLGLQQAGPPSEAGPVGHQALGQPFDGGQGALEPLPAGPGPVPLAYQALQPGLGLGLAGPEDLAPLLDGGDAWGAAFPSSHVAAALTSSVSAGWGWRPLGWALVPVAVLLTFGTVYGQFHYAVDAAVGVVLALVILAVGWAKRADVT